MRKSASDRVIDSIIVFFMLIVIVVMLYPLWNTLIVSFNDARDSIKGVTLPVAEGMDTFQLPKCVQD